MMILLKCPTITSTLTGSEINERATHLNHKPTDNRMKFGHHHDYLRNRI